MSEKHTNETAGQTPDQGSGIDKLKHVAGQLANDAEKTFEKVSDKAEDLWDKTKSGELAKDTKEAAEKAWDKVEDKAEELWDKARKVDIKEEAKEKLEDLKEGAGKLWDKIVDKFDGEDSPEKKD